MPSPYADNNSHMSLPLSEAGMNISGASSGFEANRFSDMPNDDALLAEIREILSTADLMTVTKKSIKAELERRFGVPLDSRRQYIGSATEAILSGQL